MPNYPLNLPPSASGQLLDLGGRLQMRRSVFPLVFSLLDGTFLYHGTSFCTGYSGLSCTAMHVINEGWGPRAEEMRAQGAYGAIAMTGIAYGRVTRSLFRSFVRGKFFPQAPTPVSFSTDHDASRVGYDVARLDFEWQPGDCPEPLWVRTDGRNQLKKGDTLVAVGFDQAQATKLEPGSNLYRDRLCACRLRVDDLVVREPTGMGGGPVMILDANVPGGFSGGPIFAEDGAVVGLVSTGNQFGGYATAVWLEPYAAGFNLFPEQNHSNPDWFEGWRVTGGLRSEAAAIFWSRNEAEREVARRVQATLTRVWRARFEAESWMTVS